jgi:hypothetical protein
MTPLYVRIPDEFSAQLKDAYARTYESHRLSYNKWLVALLRLGLSIGTPVLIGLD